MTQLFGVLPQFSFDPPQKPVLNRSGCQAVQRHDQNSHRAHTARQQRHTTRTNDVVVFVFRCRHNAMYEDDEEVLEDELQHRYRSSPRGIHATPGRLIGRAHLAHVRNHPAPVVHGSPDEHDGRYDAGETLRSSDPTGVTLEEGVEGERFCDDIDEAEDQDNEVKDEEASLLVLKSEAEIKSYACASLSRIEWNIQIIFILLL